MYENQSKKERGEMLTLRRGRKCPLCSGVTARLGKVRGSFLEPELVKTSDLATCGCCQRDGAAGLHRERAARRGESKRKGKGEREVTRPRGFLKAGAGGTRSASECLGRRHLRNCK